MIKSKPKSGEMGISLFRESILCEIRSSNDFIEFSRLGGGI